VRQDIFKFCNEVKRVAASESEGVSIEPPGKEKVGKNKIKVFKIVLESKSKFGLDFMEECLVATIKVLNGYRKIYKARIHRTWEYNEKETISNLPDQA